MRHARKHLRKVWLIPAGMVAMALGGVGIASATSTAPPVINHGFAMCINSINVVYGAQPGNKCPSTTSMAYLDCQRIPRPTRP